jgi:hypothetical protein
MMATIEDELFPMQDVEYLAKLLGWPVFLYLRLRHALSPYKRKAPWREPEGFNLAELEKSCK